MAYLERHVQKLVGDEAKYWEWEKKWEAVESSLGGFPAKKHYSMMAGGEDMGTMTWQREWESFAAMEASYMKMFGDPEALSLAAAGSGIIASEREEFYWVREE